MLYPVKENGKVGTREFLSLVSDDEPDKVIAVLMSAVHWRGEPKPKPIVIPVGHHTVECVLEKGRVIYGQ